jgi:glyoxylase-like metal-dependent hydrolase (beta-lactamase superfamily II)
MSTATRAVFDDVPDIGHLREVAPGIHWLRMPLPFKLDHINLWLLEDGDGWTIVDTGICRDEVKEIWQRVAAAHFGDRPVKRVIVTHFHPDHMGLAGWLTERFGVQMWTPHGEWALARLLSLETDDHYHTLNRPFYRAAGFTGERLTVMENRGNPYRGRVSPIPGAYRRIRDGETIDINGRAWRVVVGTGHSPEHACLICDDPRVMISGDQVLPKISPNVSVWPTEPDGNPLQLFLDSLPRFKTAAADSLVLPSHNWAFTGLHERLDELAHHHDQRLDDTVAACAAPATAVAVLDRLFKRKLDDHQLFFAIGESLAHLHYLMGVGRIERARTDDGVDRFHAAEAHRR